MPVPGRYLNSAGSSACWLPEDSVQLVSSWGKDTERAREMSRFDAQTERNA